MPEVLLICVVLFQGFLLWWILDVAVRAIFRRVDGKTGPLAERRERENGNSAE